MAEKEHHGDKGKKKKPHKIITTRAQDGSFGHEHMYEGSDKPVFAGTSQGTVEFLINNVVVAAAAVTNVVTGVNNANNPVLSFVISVQFSTAGTQVINVKDFGINH